MENKTTISTKTTHIEPGLKPVDSCVILKSEQKGGGLMSLGMTYTVYHIRSGADQVIRKYTDFQWLQNVLRKAYPGWLIP